MASTFGTWFTQLQRPPEARPGVHASEEPLETGPVLSCARKLELREGRPLALAYRSTENAKDTGNVKGKGRVYAQGHAQAVLGEPRSQSVEGAESGGRGTERRWTRPRTEGVRPVTSRARTSGQPPRVQCPRSGLVAQALL